MSIIQPKQFNYLIEVHAGDSSSANERDNERAPARLGKDHVATLLSIQNPTELLE